MKLTRRELGQIAGAGLIGLASRPVFAAPEGVKTASKTAGKTAGKVLIGVQSYSFRDRSLDEAFAAMKELGLTTCELWSGHVEPKDPANLGDGPRDDEAKKKHREALAKWRTETPLSFWKEIRGKAKKAGVDIYAYNISIRDTFSDAEIARAFEQAKALGARAITASSNQTTVERVAPFAKKARLPFAVHNHSEIKENEFATPEDFEKAITGPGREFISINLDIGHFTAANFDAVAFLKKHHKRIVTLHLKDRKKDQGPNLPFGQGDTPIKEVLATLRDNRWNIPANVEYEYKGADTVEEVRKSVEFCRQALVA